MASIGSIPVTLSATINGEQVEIGTLHIDVTATSPTSSLTRRSSTTTSHPTQSPDFTRKIQRSVQLSGLAGI